EPAAGNGAVELPAIAAHGVIALAEIGVVGARDLPDDAALDDIADLDGLGVGAHPADAAAHIRVERQIDALQQDFARAGFGQRRVDDVEIARHRHAFGPPLQQYLSVRLGHVSPPPLRSDHATTAACVSSSSWPGWLGPAINV